MRNEDGARIRLEVVESQGFAALSDHAVAEMARKNLSLYLSRR